MFCSQEFICINLIFQCTDDCIHLSQGPSVAGVLQVNTTDKVSLMKIKPWVVVHIFQKEENFMELFKAALLFREVGSTNKIKSDKR